MRLVVPAGTGGLRPLYARSDGFGRGRARPNLDLSGTALSRDLSRDAGSVRRERGESEPGLGILDGEVRRLRGPARIPHIGWNDVGGEHYYFDHSYVVDPSDPSLVSDWCEHGQRFPAVIERDSLLATQFHPEKSARAGRDLLTKWVQR